MNVENTPQNCSFCDKHIDNIVLLVVHKSSAICDVCAFDVLEACADHFERKTLNKKNESSKND